MTAQAKPPKGAAKAAPVKSTPVPREINEIEKLFKRYKWLEADRDFQAATASTEKEFNRLFGIPDSELNAIAKRLAELRPQTFQEARWLLELVLLSFTEEGVRGDGLDEQVFRNALESLSEIARKAKYKARDEGYEEAYKNALFYIEMAKHAHDVRVEYRRAQKTSADA